MRTLQFFPGGFNIIDDANQFVIMHQPFDPRTGLPFSSDEESADYAKEYLQKEEAIIPKGE